MDLNKLMQQAQEMQKKMKEMQDEMTSKEYEGQSGGNSVSVTLTGDGNMKSVKIDDSLMQESEKDMLEDLIVAAYNNAKSKIEEDSKNNMSGMFGGLAGKMPPGMF